jgi:hypothetical protein
VSFHARCTNPSSLHGRRVFRARARHSASLNSVRPTRDRRALARQTRPEYDADETRRDTGARRDCARAG